MKGFPNQVSNLHKLTTALTVCKYLLSSGSNVRNDQVFGEELVRYGVAGAGHSARPVEDYLDEQRQKPSSYRAFRTTARGLRELFRILGLITDDGIDVALTKTGESIVAKYYEESRLFTPELLEMWRTVIHAMIHEGGYGGISHPYQVLLRLIAKRPGISRAKCALALEAKDDSDSELNRIARLSDMEEESIIREISATKMNWDNAKKILPSFAEQLGDVVKIRGAMHLALFPGVFSDKTKNKIKKPRIAREVSAKEIAQSGTLDSYDEVEKNTNVAPDPGTMASRKKKLLDRLRRHNMLVQRVAAVCEKNGAKLFENPFDCLACFDGISLLIEIKSLDGSEVDEQAQVRSALAQLLYYEAFVTKAYAEDRTVVKVAVFESKISDEHAEWLRSCTIKPIWIDQNKLCGSLETVEVLSSCLGTDITAF